MKRSTHFFTIPSYFSLFPSSNLLTMNNSTTPRHWALGVLVFCALALCGPKAAAQCTLQPFPLYAPVPTFNLPLDAVFPGEADLNGNVLLGYFSSDCAFNGPNGIIRIYDSSDPMIDPTGVSSEVFTCAQVGQTFTRWVTIEGLIPVQAESTPRKQIVVTIVDNIAPTIVVPAGPFPRNADAGPAGTCRYTIIGTEFNPTSANDNCASTFLEYRIDGGTWTAGSTLAGVTLNGVGSHTIQWRITDGALPTANVTTANAFTVNITDVTPPSISCPGNQSINTNPTTGCTAVASGISAIFSDNCSVTKLTWSSSGATTTSSPATGINDASGTTFDKGVTTVIYTAADAANNTATCAFTVTVNDNVAPALVSTPANVTVGTSTGNTLAGYSCNSPLEMCGTSSSFNAITGSGYTSTSVVSNCLSETLNESWFYMHVTAAGTVIRNVAITPNNDIDYAVWGPFPSLASANCAALSTANEVDCDFSGNNGGTINFGASVGYYLVVINNYDDEAGVVNLDANSGTATIACGEPVNLCLGSTSWTNPTITDNCASPYTLTMQIGAGPATTVTEGGYAASVFALGSTTITYVATDNSGRTSVSSFTVTVQDDVAPVVAGPTNQIFTVSVNSSTCDKVISWTRPSIGSPVDCGPVTMSETFVSGPDPTVLNGLVAFNTTTGGGSATTNFPSGTTVIRYSWIDNAPNSPDFSVLYTFNVEEDIAPTALCKNVSLQLDANGEAILTTAAADFSSTDNCPLGVTYVLQSSNGAVIPMSSSLLFDCGDLVMQPGSGWPYSLIVSDANNNKDTADCFVTILDVLAPVLSCPSNQIVYTANNNCTATIGANGNLVLDANNILIPGEYDGNCAVVSITATANNNADLSAAAGVQASVNFTGTNPSSSLNSAVFAKGTTNVVYTCSDQSNNNATCAFTVTVLDTIRPVATGCPPGGVISLPINTLSCNHIPSSALWNVSWSDPGSCSLPLNITTVGGAPNNSYPQGETQITITANDQSGNVGTCAFIIDVFDAVPPVALCKNIPVNLSAAPTTVTASQINNGSTDNCTLLNPTNFALQGYPSGVPVTNSSCSNIPVTLVVTDRDGNTATCTANVVITDNVAPVCTTKNVVKVLSSTNPGSVSVDAIDFNNGSSDNCTSNNALVFEISSATGTPTGFNPALTFDCTPLGANTVTFRVKDAQGNISSNCTATLTIQDATPPVVVSAPGNQIVSCELVTPSIQAYLNTLTDATFSDNCTVANVVEIFSTTNGSCPSNYTILRTWTATDGAGLTAQAQQTINVLDLTKPSITLPANVTINLSSVADCFPTGSYTATLSDNCTASNTLATNTSWVIDYADGAADDLGSGATATSIAGFATGVNTITFTTTDACGNTSTKSMTVTVVDNEAPLFVDYLLPNPNPTFTSYCGHSFVFDNAPGVCGYTFQWIRPYNGNVDECNNFTFGPESIVANGNQTVSANFPWDPTNPFTQFIPVSVTLPVGTAVFKYTVTDLAGNSSTCSFTVKVEDVQAPILIGQQTALLTTICPTQTIPDYTGLVSVIDNCPSGNTLTQVPAAGTALSAINTYITPGPNPADGSQFVVTITGFDGTNFSVPRNITVTLDDNTAPIPSQNALADVTSNCGFIILQTPTAQPNCTNGSTIFGTPGGVNATPETTNGTIITSYRVTLVGTTCQTYFVTWSYNDGNGNVSTQLQKVTICPDVAPPLAKCKNTVTNINLSPFNATITPQMIDADNGSFSINGSHDPDNCSAAPTPKKVTLSLSQSVYTCADLSKTTVTLTATDNAGNTASCTASIKVIDVNAPVITGTLPANVTIEACVDAIPAMPALPAVTDNCSATVTVNENTNQASSGVGKYNYVITRTWTATDTYGNTATASRTITVRDTKKPEFTAPTPASLLFKTDPADADCAQTTKLVLAPIVADCAPDNELVISSNPAYFSLTDSLEILPVGSHVVTFTATDPSGNSASFSVTIVVSDITPPVASCINGISVALNPNGQAIVTPSLVNNSSFDNCTSAPVSLQVQELYEANGDTIGNPVNQIIFDCDEADGDTRYPIILVVKDAVGNSSFCETYVVIQDNVTPTITCPANTTVNCSATPNTAFATSVLGNATATDNCPITAGSITFVDVPVSNGYSCNSFVRTFRATDLSGNSSTCNQTVTVQDLVKPVFTSLPQSDTISCSDPLVLAPTLKATDNCTPADSIKIVFTQVKTDSVGECGKYEYKVTRTWTATDKCGNTAIHTQILKVEDVAEPVFLGMPDTITVSSANFPTNTDCTVPLSFDVAQYLSDCQSDTSILVTNDAPHGNLSTDISGNYTVGNYLVSFSAIDACGNVGLDSVFIVVRDNSVPTVICNDNVVISLGTNGVASILPDDIDLGSTDNCGIDSMWLSKTDFDCGELGANAIQLFVKDVHGNMNSCTVNVQVALGVNTGFNVTATATDETSFGANNGTASVTVTGGTGSFTYLWNTTASTPTISNLIPGTYTVTITDTNTGCVNKVTVVVNEGPSLVITAGAASGCQGAVVSIPVTVGNLVSSTGFSFTLNLTNNTVGTFTGLTNINPALTGLISNVLPGNTLGVFWANAGAPLNLPNNTVLFNVNLTLGTATIGTTSSLNFASSPIPLEFNINNAGMDVTLDINDIDINNGSVTINCVVNDFDITGKIETWRAPVKPVPGATVALTGGISNSAITPADGTYAFTVPAGNLATLTPTKSTTGNDGVTAADLLFISNHIFGNLLTSPYQWVAADANGDGNITLNDYLRIQRVALGTDQHILGAPDWKFIPKSFTFPTPNPLSPNTYPLNFSLTALADANVDFVAVRMGDVNGNITPSFNNDQTEDRTEGNFNFRIEDKGFKANEIIEVPFRASDFTNRQAYQMTIGFDANMMTLESIEMGALPKLSNENFGTAQLAEGNLTTLWVSKDPVSIADDEVLFTLRFRTLRSVRALSEVLSAGSQVIRAEAYDLQGSIMKVDLEFTKPANGQDIAPFALYQNQPNPFSAETRIGFRLPESGRGIVRVYNMGGQLVKTVVGNFEKGYNELSFRKDELGKAGVYWYELETSTHSDRKKMILID